MAPKVIREDLVVPFRHVPVSPRSEVSGMIAQSLPMAAMFMRNKLLSWSSLFLAIQSYLNEPINKASSASDGSQPPLLRIVFALVSLLTCYLELLFPAYGPAAKKASLANISETISSTISSATGTGTGTS